MGLNIVSKIDNQIKINNIIISVSDKTGLDKFVEKLVLLNKNVKIFSTGGTYSYLKELDFITEGKNLISVSDYTKQPEMQGGLVKTLDFRIYIGLLSEKYNKSHQDDLSRTESVLFDMVVVNLYPFKDVIKKENITIEEARTNIDIGGPCMLRASAKNFHRVASVSTPAQYDSVLAEIEKSGGSLSLETRFRLAGETFALTAGYDKAIADFFASADPKTFSNIYNIQTN